MRTAHDHPIAPASGLVAIARLNLYEKIGPGLHPCNWCGTIITWKPGNTPGALLADHLDWNRSNDAPENLVASCHLCNSKRTNSGRPLADGELTMMWSNCRTRAVKRECEWCAEEFLTIPAQVAKGMGRFCSRSCAGKGRTCAA